ncbi:hypothetical protein GCM10009687_28210 [Asanoa iriomotensis]|uniref:Uncharacterized protein n=1 Tax=Asanoa iriomotensis TaxID=234613 RepID=A0ABQ4CD13_9ACTN|nr:hypothetical protein Air01nite_63150 [Asanoa iriomotensis]
MLTAPLGDPDAPRQRPVALMADTTTLLHSLLDLAYHSFEAGRAAERGNGAANVEHNAAALRIVGQLMDSADAHELHSSTADCRPKGIAGRHR